MLIEEKHKVIIKEHYKQK